MAKTTFSGPVQSLNGFQDANGDPVGGSPIKTVQSVTANYDTTITVNNTDEIMEITSISSSMPIEINLPTGTHGQVKTFVYINKGGGFAYVRINPNSNALNWSDLTLSNEGSSVTLLYTGRDKWSIINSHDAGIVT